MAATEDYTNSVFVNCPFDARYRKMFRAIVFTIVDCGFTPRCGLELSDSSVDRLDKLFHLMSKCRLGVHDISRTGLYTKARLPRFNMPFELGIFLGAKRFGSGRQKMKNCIIMDTKKYRYQKFISDIGGKDIKAHGNNVPKAIKAVRDWLADCSNVLIPGAKKMADKYDDFLYQLPGQCRALDLVPRDLTFNDFRILAETWLEKYDEEMGHF